MSELRRRINVLKNAEMLENRYRMMHHVPQSHRYDPASVNYAGPPILDAARKAKQSLYGIVAGKAGELGDLMMLLPPYSEDDGPKPEITPEDLGQYIPGADVEDPAFQAGTYFDPKGLVKKGLLGSIAALGVLKKRMAHGTFYDFLNFRKGGLGPHWGTREQANERLKHLSSRYHSLTEADAPNVMHPELISREIIYDPELNDAGMHDYVLEGANIRHGDFDFQKSLRMNDIGAWEDSQMVLLNLPEEARQAIGWTDADVEDLYWRIERDRSRLSSGPRGSMDWYKSEENQKQLRFIKEKLQGAGYDSIVYENAVENKFGRRADWKPRAKIVRDQIQSRLDYLENEWEVFMNTQRNRPDAKSVSTGMLRRGELPYEENLPLTGKQIKSHPVHQEIRRLRQYLERINREPMWRGSSDSYIVFDIEKSKVK